MKLREALKTMGRVLTPYRAGVTTDGLKHNKYRSRCFGRGACNRRAGGCDIHAAFDSPTGLIYPAMDTGNLTLRTNATAHEITRRQEHRQGARRLVHRQRRRTRRYEAKAKVVVLAASTLESARLLLLSKSPQHPNGIGNSSGHVGHNFCEHVMGPGVTGLVKDLVGKPHTHRRRPARRLLRPALPQSPDKQSGLHSRLRLRGQRRHSRCFPSSTRSTPGFGAAYKKEVRDYAGAFINMGGVRRSAAALREPGRASIPNVKDTWGIPVLRFNYKFGDNEKKMGEDMADIGAGDVRGRRDRDRRRRSASC